MKKAWRVFSLVLAVVMVVSVLAACRGNSDESPSETSEGNKESSTSQAETQSNMVESNDPLGPFSETVTISIGKSTSSEFRLPEGSTFEDNEYVYYIEKKLNVDFVHAWQANGDAYGQKVDLCISSGDIPDVMSVSESQLRMMVNAGLVEDLTEAFNNNICPELKAAFDSTDGRSLKRATFDGKLMAVPNVSPGADSINLLWVRQDWLDKLGLPVPKTMEDIENTIKAFIESDPDGNGKDDTVGLLGKSNIVEIGNNLYGFDTIFSLYDAYPELWIKNQTGEVAYGSIQPEVKMALAKIREMYAAGLIEKEFVAKKDENNNELVVSGKAGIFFSPWWIPFWPLNDSVKQDPKAEWRAYVAPLDDAGKFKTHVMSPTVDFLVVKKGFKNPAAVIRTLNYQFIMDQNQGEGLYNNEVGMYSWNYLPFTLLLCEFDEKERKAMDVNNVLDGKVSPDTLKSERKLIYESALKERENPKKDIAAWAQANAFLTGALPLNGDNIVKVYGEFYGQTPTMEKKWANLEKLEDECFLKIIMGNAPVDDFDKFVADWKKLGGDEITNEVIQSLK